MAPRFRRRSVLAALPPLLAAPAVVRAAVAFPVRPLRLIVPYPPGGVTDIMGRLVAEPMGRHLGQPVVVENRPGAGGNIGAIAAAQAEPDGHTLFLGTMATHGVNPVIYPDARLDPVRDFVGVGTISDMPNVLVCNPRRFDAASVAQVIERAKRRPGELLFGSVGNGSSSHLSQAMFARMAGIAFTHVPYRGSSPAVTAMLAGDLDLLFDASATSTAHVRAGAVRALAVTTRRRLSSLPEVPTMEEAGVPGYHLSVWTGIFTQSRVPPAVLEKLQAAFNASMDAAMLQRLRDNHTEPLLVPTADLQRWLREDQAHWMRIAREVGLRAD
ncbi:Bug family tripartite tricarboxylate transporter substrate binding protein [Caldovatus aquaticus]|uniref:Tripartite tricarboxylate transporter substrate binding protein n=1 Tax=Caldovatus aquaticus TaxID=2865671 RepID=A0ABS7EZL3_9PROT|nr:tripartite tricarboxylate transporter substrate binding protein [Caldovatus aquaticus]MBW8268779.1 tripartite tricarboxylate transporter substrate binding protein [Caldovatus aquaticus]